VVTLPEFGRAASISAPAPERHSLWSRLREFDDRDEFAVEDEDARPFVARSTLVLVVIFTVGIAFRVWAAKNLTPNPQIDTNYVAASLHVYERRDPNAIILASVPKPAYLALDGAKNLYYLIGRLQVGYARPPGWFECRLLDWSARHHRRVESLRVALPTSGQLDRGGQGATQCELGFFKVDEHDHLGRRGRAFHRRAIHICDQDETRE
jgi:hypothetical protein